MDETTSKQIKYVIIITFWCSRCGSIGDRIVNRIRRTNQNKKGYSDKPLKKPTIFKLVKDILEGKNKCRIKR